MRYNTLDVGSPSRREEAEGNRRENPSALTERAAISGDHKGPNGSHDEHHSPLKSYDPGDYFHLDLVRIHDLAEHGEGDPAAPQRAPHSAELKEDSLCGTSGSRR